MTVEKLERVMWRLRKKHVSNAIILNSSLRRAIMLEIGTDPRTYALTRKALLTLKWIKSHSKTSIKLTGHDITGE